MKQQPASWDISRSDESLASFVLNKLTALENITLED